MRGLNNAKVSRQEVVVSQLIVPFGIATLALVATTVTLGLLMPRNRPMLFRWHRRTAITALVCGLCHGTLVFLLH